jgi:ATP-dependent Clp protease protease subunit
MSDQTEMVDAGSKLTAFYGFAGVIDSQGATRIAAALNAAVNGGYSEVQFCFSSLGGYVADGIYLYNHIRGLPLKVVAHNIGSVSSIAVAVFVAAEERYCSSHAMFMTHPTAFPTLEGMTAERLNGALAAALADDGRTENILRERTAIPDDILAKRRISDVHITPLEAVTYGLVQGVREFALPRGQQIIQI